jgi:hypothetical protein
MGIGLGMTLIAAKDMSPARRMDKADGHGKAKGARY